MKDFIAFIREQGVIGLAIGFITGGAVSSLVQSLVNDILQPIIGLFLPSADRLAGVFLGPVALGKFLAVCINFILILAVVYYIFKKLQLEKIDEKKK